MTKRQQQAQNNEQQQQQSPLAQRGGVGLSPQRQQEQAIMLEPFYERLIGMTFDQSTTAIERCRDLCAEFGFTVKQEASTHRNIYVYCSREGLPDSLRNPKSNPQRKRPSKRCDCRWRVVLYENEDHWEFRKSLNPEAGKHNHELMRPEEIERSWPKEVTTLICELARLRMTTQEIRNRVRAQFPNIHWNERRFYNRLSEERQKIKTRDSAERTQQLNSLWGKVCMATAGNDDLSEFVKQEMIMLFQSICDTVQINPQNFPSPLVLQDTQEGNEGGGAGGDDTASTPASTTANNDYDMPASSSAAPPEGSSKKTTFNAPKGYLPIEIPKQIYYIKIHNQRQLHETQLLKNARKTTRSTFNTDQQQEASSSLEPPRKISRKGKARQSSSSSMLADADHQTTENNMQLNSPLIPQPSFTTNSRSSQAQPIRQQEVHQQQQQQPTQFVYYESSSPMPLDSTALSNYVHHQHQSFQNPYTMSTSSPSSTPNGFNAPTELTFSFDSSSMSGGGNNGGRNNSSEGGGNSNSNEPTIHPALQSAPMSHQQQQKSHQQQEQRMYTTNKPSPPQQQQQQMRIIYESPKDGNNNSLRSLLPDNNNQQSYQQQRQQQGMYNTIRPSSPRSHHQHHHGGGANTIMPMYPQQQQQQQQQHPSQ